MGGMESKDAAASYAARVAERLCHSLGTSPVLRTDGFGARL